MARPALLCREPGLFRLVACGPEDAFAFEMDRTEQYSSGAAPAVQLVLQYSMLLPASPAAGEEQEGGSGGTRWGFKGRAACGGVQWCFSPCAKPAHDGPSRFGSPSSAAAR